MVSRRDRLQRVFDIVLVSLTAPVWSPLLGVLLIAKRCFDGAPVFFRHVRVGMHGRTFHLLKIRTTALGFQPRPQDWPSKNYPPRTRFGNWLRRCDLDELPQLWNVLKGEMSLIGPRPETPYHTARFSDSMPRYGERCHVRPGLSGLAQLRGLRGDTDVDKRLQADLDYIARRGPWLYARIFFGTLWLELRQVPDCFRMFRGAQRCGEHPITSGIAPPASTALPVHKCPVSQG